MDCWAMKKLIFNIPGNYRALYAFVNLLYYNTIHCYIF